MVNVTLPEFDEFDDVSTINYWYFEPGDFVEEGEDLVEVETNSGTYTIPSPASGKIADIFFTEGDEIEAGEVIASIEEEE